MITAYPLILYSSKTLDSSATPLLPTRYKSRPPSNGPNAEPVKPATPQTQSKDDPKAFQPDSLPAYESRADSQRCSSPLRCTHTTLPRPAGEREDRRNFNKTHTKETRRMNDDDSPISTATPGATSLTRHSISATCK
jgi:hypothetical protein